VFDPIFRVHSKKNETKLTGKEVEIMYGLVSFSHWIHFLVYLHKAHLLYKKYPKPVMIQYLMSGMSVRLN